MHVRCLCARGEHIVNRIGSGGVVRTERARCLSVGQHYIIVDEHE
jgi:hypothetical protein